jgi:protein-L-isoaspartate(D-aspartate) O-methyltransferase
MTDSPNTHEEERHLERRHQMVERQLRQRGIYDDRVLEAMRSVPRHRFVDSSHVPDAYGDHPLPIGAGQTISQPYMVARMTELCGVQPTDRCLEVGAGCGYQTAVLATLALEVYAAEIVESLVDRARVTLASLGYTNVTLACRDASGGWPEHAPFDVILVAAGAPTVPPALSAQLAEGGRLVIPVGSEGLQVLQCIKRSGEDFLTEKDTACRFVKLRGDQGWNGHRP